MLCGVMNLPQPPTKFALYNEILLEAVDEECTDAMKDALEEAVVQNGGSRDISVALDGSWQKRGFSSKNGIVLIQAKSLTFLFCPSIVPVLIRATMTVTVPVTFLIRVDIWKSRVLFKF